MSTAAAAKTLTRAELIAWLDCDAEHLKDLIAQGLPHSRGRFDPAAVGEWLQTQGLASPAGIVATVAEIARAFNVRPDTISGQWKPCGMPGTDGHYDLAAIAEWRSTRRGANQPSDQGKALMAAKIRDLTAAAELKEFKRAIQRGELVRLDEIQRWAASCFTRVRSRLEDFPDEMQMLFPPAVRDDVTEQFRNQIRLTLKQMGEWKNDDEDDTFRMTADDCILAEAARIQQRRAACAK